MHWYLAITKLKSEIRVKENLWANHQIETFFPTYKPKKADSKVGLALFPRYIFLHCDIEKHYSQIQYTPGLSRMVMFGNEIPPVSQEVINYLKERCDQNDILLPPPLDKGQKVRVTSGIFKGLEGIIAEKRGNQRVKLLLEVAFQGNVSVELANSQVIPVRS